MKKILFAAMAAIILLASCSKNNENPGGATVEKAKLNISVTAPVLSRAAGATVATDAVANFSVFITDLTGQIKYKAYSSTGTDLTGANAITVDNQAQHVYVVANAGDLTTGAGAITTMALLNTYLADLNGTGSQAAARWATGQTSSVLSFTQTGDDFVATTTVALTFIAARITLTIENGMTGYDATATDGSLVLKNVAVLNARGQSKLFGASLIPGSYTAGKKFYMGMDNPTPPSANFPAAGDYTYDATTAILLGDAIPADDFSQTYYYYVFENDAAIVANFPTIITLVGEFDSKPMYYPIHLAPYEQWTGGSSADFIKRGHSYDINVKLTVDPAIGGGTIDPTDPVITASVEVSITLTPWIPVVLGKEFN